MANTANPTISTGSASPTLNATTTEAVIAGRAAKLTTTTAGQRTCAMADAGEKCVGIFAESYASGDMAMIVTSGTFPMETDGSGTSIAAGDPLKATTNGVGIKAASNNDFIIGFAADPSTTDGAVIGVVIAPGYLGA